MNLGLEIKELAGLVHVTSNTIINWELRNVKTSALSHLFRFLVTIVRPQQRKAGKPAKPAEDVHDV